MSEIKRITDVKLQRKNANKHSQRGMGQLEKSVQTDGLIGAITVAADNETFDGSARVEVLAAAFGDVEPIIVESDGTRPIIHRRIDIPNADDPRAKRLGVAANRIAQTDLEWDVEILSEIGQDVDLSGLFFPHEIAAMLEQAGTDVLDAAELWKGMPEFEQEDKTAYQSIHIHFKNQDAVEEFSRLINQTITDKTRSLWFPYIEIERYADKRYSDES